MRPNHNHKNNNRMRGRHRKQTNPLTRSYESNGPDIKVRGTPQHIVEKYSQLARDAQVSGDPVLAEAYLQHAEHYFRIISAAQQDMARAQGFGRPGEVSEADDSDDDTDDEGYANGQLYPTLRPPQHQQGGFQRQSELAEAPQPDGQPFVPRERPQYNRQERGDRQDRVNFDRGERPDGEQPRGERQESRQDNRQDNRQDGRADRGERQDRGPSRNRFERGPRQDFRDRRPQADVAEVVEAALPAFITGGIPRPVVGDAPESTADAPPAFDTGDAGAGEARAPFRQRRRRREPGVEGDAAGASGVPRGEAVE